MRRIWFSFALLLICASFSETAPAGPYKILNSLKAGGLGGFDYVYADASARLLYVPRLGDSGRVMIFNIDKLEQIGELAGISAHGVAVSERSHHAFATSNPITMWDSETFAMIRFIPVDGSPDGILYDPFNDRVYIFSHKTPNTIVIDASDGSIVGTIDLGGAPEQAATDGQGHIYVDIEDKDSIAVVDAKTLTVTDHFDLAGQGGACAGFAMDVQNQILFASCRNPHKVVILNAGNGTIITALPIGQGTDGAVFNPNTMEAFSSQSDGTLSVIKENSPTSFVVEQTLQTMPGARTMTLDTRTNILYLLAAEYDELPTAPRFGESGGRRQMLPDSFTILAVGR
jgi:DNA-binding beta-propeller fold protein YncE